MVIQEAIRRRPTLEMKVEVATFEEAMGIHCANLGIPTNLMVDYIDVTLWETKRKANSIMYGIATTYVSGNVPPEITDKIRRIRAAMATTSKGRDSLQRFTEKDAIPVIQSVIMAEIEPTDIEPIQIEETRISPTLLLAALDPTLEAKRFDTINYLEQALKIYRASKS